MYTISTNPIFKSVHILRETDQAHIPVDLRNSDYQRFLHDLRDRPDDVDGDLSEEILKDLDSIKTAE